MEDFRPGAGLELVVLVGLQGSGKSSFFRHFYGGTHAHVSKDLFPNNRDKARRQRMLIDEALGRGQSVVVDNTNLTKEVRQVLIAQARAHGAKVIAVYVESELKDCLRRNAAREGRAKIPVPGILATRKKLQPPSLEEGFDALYVARLDEARDAFDIRRISSG